MSHDDFDREFSGLPDEFPKLDPDLSLPHESAACDPGGDEAEAWLWRQVEGLEAEGAAGVYPDGELIAGQVATHL